MFDFVRNEALNARNYFARSNPVKPLFRRDQYGGVAGGPLRESRTFFFFDYQGQRQDIGRTVVSTVPTLLQRKGIFTEPINGKVATIFDPNTTGAGNLRTAFPNNAIPGERFDSVAKALLARYPLPTSAGTANNYTRVGDEIDNQNQFDIRLDHHFLQGRDSMFARLSSFKDDFVPVTPLPEGSGVTTGTLGPQKTNAWSFASNYIHVISPRFLNELRIGDTRRAVTRTATTMSGTALESLGLPGIPDVAQFPTTLPTFQISGYTQLGSPAGTASDFKTDVTEIADSMSFLVGKHAFKWGADLRWERLNVIQPSSPTGLFTFSTLFTDQPGTTGTGFPLASFLLGQVATYQIDFQPNEIRNRAHFQEYFVQDDWKITSRLTANLGVRYTLNFPSTEEDNQVAVFICRRSSSIFSGRTACRARRGSCKKATSVRGSAWRGGRPMTWWCAPAMALSGSNRPASPRRSRRRHSRSCKPCRSARSTTSPPAFVLASGPSAVPAPIGPNAGLGQGVFCGQCPRRDRATSGSGTPRFSARCRRHMTLEVAYVGSKITNVGVPDANINQLTADQLAMGNALLVKVANPFFGTIPRSSSLGDPTITVAQLLKPYPEFTAVTL